MSDTTATYAVAVTLMGEDEARQCATRIRKGMENVRVLLLDLYEREGWKALGYDSWRACVTVELRQSVATVYRQLRAAEADRALSQVENPPALLPTVQAEQLMRLPDDATRREVWQEVREAKGEATTARDLSEATDRRLGATRPPAPVRYAPSPDFGDAPDDDGQHEPAPDLGMRCGDCGEPVPHGVDECPTCAQATVDQSASPSRTREATRREVDAHLRAEFLVHLKAASRVAAYQPARIAEVLPPDDAGALESAVVRLGAWIDKFREARGGRLRVVGGSE